MNKCKRLGVIIALSATVLLGACGAAEQVEEPVLTKEERAQAKEAIQEAKELSDEKKRLAAEGE